MSANASRRRVEPIPFDWQLPLTIAPGAAGAAAIGASPQRVPPRRERGTMHQEHMERHAAFFALRHLHAARPQLFPATLAKSEAPDFLLTAANGSVLALEHTEFAAPGDQVWSATTSGTPGTHHVPGPGGVDDKDGWVGDSPERVWIDSILVAISRKSDDRCWRNAPPGAERWLLLYDQVNAPVDDSVKREWLAEGIPTSEELGFQVAVISNGRAIVVDVQEAADHLEQDLSALADDPAFVAAIMSAERDVEQGRTIADDAVMASLRNMLGHARNRP